MQPKPIPRRSKDVARHYCIMYPDGRIMNADTAPTARGLRTPALYANRKMAHAAIVQRLLPDGMTIGRIETTASWRVIK